MSRLRMRAVVVDGSDEPRWIYELHEGPKVDPWAHVATSRFIADWEVAQP